LSGYTVADLCRRWRCGAEKVRGFLDRGELVGINIATNLCGRPQWRITAESVEKFERRRSSAPPPKPPRRRKKIDEIDYYPDEPS
jgi:hypothetical protein